jgi:hypothetical protein
LEGNIPVPPLQELVSARLCEVILRILEEINDEIVECWKMEPVMVLPPVTSTAQCENKLWEKTSGKGRQRKKKLDVLGLQHMRSIAQ